MVKTLLVLLLMGLAHCQSTDDLLSLSRTLTMMYGPKQPVENNQVSGKPPSRNVVVPPIQTVTEVTGHVTECTTPNGLAGECIPYHQCGNSDLTVQNSSNGVIDLHYSSSNCNSYLDVCCQTSDIFSPNQPPKPIVETRLREGCGWANPNGVDSRISSPSNEYTKFGEFPWMVAIVKVEPLSYNEPKGKRLMVYIGGGSLIHPSVVLTVAHYADSPRPLKVRAGEWDTQVVSEPYPHQERDVTSVEIHKDFNKGNQFYDIAILFLDKPMDLALNVGVACLAPAHVPQREKTRCVATGWGKDKFGKEGRYQVMLKKVELPVVNHKECQAALRETRLGRFFELHSSFMCAGGEPGKDTCLGDGGAPLSCPIDFEKDRYVQSGIVAWGIGCGEDGTPGVYVDVSVLRDWIDDKVVGKGYDPRTYSY